MKIDEAALDRFLDEQGHPMLQLYFSKPEAWSEEKVEELCAALCHLWGEMYEQEEEIRKWKETEENIAKKYITPKSQLSGALTKLRKIEALNPPYIEPGIEPLTKDDIRTAENIFEKANKWFDHYIDSAIFSFEQEPEQKRPVGRKPNVIRLALEIDLARVLYPLILKSDSKPNKKQVAKRIAELKKKYAPSLATDWESIEQRLRIVVAT